MLVLQKHKRPALGVSMKQARQMREMHKDDPFAEPNNGVLRPAVFENYAALALREGEQPPAGWVELKCSEFTARIFVPSK